MTIKIDFTDNISITKEKSSFDIRNFESISLTAADFTAKPGHFNLLPSEITLNRQLAEQYMDNFNKVNQSKEIGVMNQFAPPIYLLVPKTKGEEKIENILIDLFNALKKIQVKELCMTHWMYIRNKYPNYEIKTLVEFLKLKHKKYEIERIFLHIDERYEKQFMDDLETLK